MREVVFMVEEPSMRAFLEPQLGQLLPEGFYGRVVPHQGKSDLQRSLPRKLRAWRTPGSVFVVLHDQDQCDCVMLKGQLAELCRDASQRPTLVRIVCRNLESWILGDLVGLAATFGNDRLPQLEYAAKYRNPDAIANGIEILQGLVPGYQKVSGARAMAKHHKSERNRSPSFQAFFKGLAGFLT